MVSRAPIGEPMITGDHGADFIAGGMRAGGIIHAARRNDDELVGRQHQLPYRSPASRFGSTGR